LRGSPERKGHRGPHTGKITKESEGKGNPDEEKTTGRTKVKTASNTA